MKILSELENLVAAQVIDTETAEKIRLYYTQKEKKVQTGFVFGVLGAALVGLGIILLIAHNWDGITRPVKTAIAFLPLVIGQGLCGYTLAKKACNKTWRESSAIFLVLGLGASIALIAQVYHIPGYLSDLLFLWMLLALPVVYIMRSSVAGLFYIVGITGFVLSFDFFQNKTARLFYPLLLASVLPYYYFLARKNIESRVVPFFNFFISASLTICLGFIITALKPTEMTAWLFYINLFAFYILLGQTKFLKKQFAGGSIISVFGHLGMLVILFIASFFKSEYTQAVNKSNIVFLLAILIFTALIAFFVLQNRYKIKSNIISIPLINYVFIPIFIIFSFSKWGTASRLAINLLIFLTALYFIINGLKAVKAGVLNYGLIILIALVAFRFFDTSISFIIRGAAFVIVGVGFFIANYVLFKKRGKNENK